MNAERRWDDVFVQDQLFDKLSPQVGETVKNVFIQAAISQFHFFPQKVDDSQRVNRWLVSWDLEQAGRRITGKQIEIYLKFPTPGSQRSVPFYLAPARIRSRSRHRRRDVTTANLSEEGLKSLVAYVINHPFSFRQIPKVPPGQNLGCPAGCNASFDRLLSNF